MGKMKEVAIKQRNSQKTIEGIADEFMDTWSETLGNIIHDRICGLDACEMEEISNKVYDKITNQRVIEELELILSIEKETGIVPINALKHRIKELKQE
jgi:hypothetical protein